VTAKFPVYPVKSCHAGVALLLFNRVYPMIIRRGFIRVRLIIRFKVTIKFSRFKTVFVHYVLLIRAVQKSGKRSLQPASFCPDSILAVPLP